MCYSAALLFRAGKPAYVTIMEGKIYVSAPPKKSPSKPHFLGGDYCSDSREYIIFNDVTVYICDTNDSCGFA